MATVEKRAEFNVPVDKAFSTIADISQWPQWIPPLTNVADISGEGMGSTYNWEFKLGPLPAFKGTGEITKLIPNRRFEVQTKGIPSKWLFEFANRENQTVISANIEYNIPGGGIASKLVSKQVEESLGLLRGILEA